MHTNKFRGWLAILALPVLLFVGCFGDDDTSTNFPVIGTVTDIVNQDSRFSTLASALERTGLDATLDIFSASYTVFAPTDAAFQASGIDLNSVSDDELANILRYHVIGNSVRSADIPDGDSSLETLASGPVGPNLPLFVANSGGVSFNGGAVNLDEADIEAVNGVIHIIDNVLVPPTIADRAVLDGRFTTLLSALSRTGLDGVLSDAGTFTVFAPTDDAFAASGIDLDALSDDDLEDVLLYHVLGTSLLAGDFPGGDGFYATLNTDGPDDAPYSLLTTPLDETIQINGSATVVAADVVASNGIIHGVDQVLMPQSIVDFVINAASLDSLQQAVTAAGLVPTLSGDGPFTVFAPNNGAFGAAADTIATFTAEQIGRVLTYHVLGDNVRSDELFEGDSTRMTLNEMLPIRFSLNDNGTDDDTDDDFAEIQITDSTFVNFTTVDIQGTNGVLHIIDQVLLPSNL